MPAESVKQQHLFGMALAAKRGRRVKVGKDAMRIAKTLSEEKIKDFASLKK